MANGSRIASTRIGADGNGSGRIDATRSRREKKEPAAMNNATHLRYKVTAQTGDGANPVGWRSSTTSSDVGSDPVSNLGA